MIFSNIPCQVQVLRLYIQPQNKHLVDEQILSSEGKSYVKR